MIQSFHDKGTEDVYDGTDSKAARRTCPPSIWKVAQRELDQLHAAGRLDQLRVPPGNHLEKLEKDREGQHSIRINAQHRICFVWTDAGPERVEITDYH